MKSRKLLALLLSLALTASLALPVMADESDVAANPYPGVETGAWYEEAAKYVMDGGLMTSTGSGFDPSGTVTRATVFQVLYNMEGKPAASASSYADTADKWYASAAAWAESTGLASVGADKLFHGDRAATRQEVATILARYIAYAGINADQGGMAMKEMADYDAIASWALEGMGVCYYNGLMTGKPGNLLDPAGTATRAELATMLMKLDKLPMSYTEETVAISVPEQDGIPAHDIPAIVTLPVGDGKYPAVIMLHGTGSDKNEAGGGYAMAAPAMAKAGIATIRIDFMGNGDSKADYVNYNYTSAKLDAKAAADYMAKLSAVDAAKLGVMGWSQGGTDALLAAAAYPDTFKAVVTWSGATSLGGNTLFPEGFDAAYAAAKKDGSYTMKFDWRGDLNLGKRWFEEVKSTDVLKETAKIKAPVLAVNGDLDTTVPMDNAIAIKKAAPLGSDWIVDGADHTYNVFTGDNTAINNTIDATIGFFHKALVEGYVEITLGVPNGERVVPAVITVPTTGNGPFPAVVMNHGHGGSKDENVGFIGVAETLAKSGIATIRMDFPGCGVSSAPFTDNTLTNMISDSNACKDYLIKNYPVDKDKLGILGYSMGGRIALTILGQKDNHYQAAVLLSASADPGQEMATRLLGSQEAYDAAYAAASKDGYYTFTTQYGQVQDLSKAWFDDMKASEPLKNIANYTGPMLVMHGDKDVVVDDTVNKSIVTAYPKATEVVIADADHGYGFYSDQGEVTAAVEGGIASFFAANLGVKTAASGKAA